MSMSRKLLAGPYLIWMICCTVVPLGMIVYYGLTDRSGAFTFANLSAITVPAHAKALGLALLLASTGAGVLWETFGAASTFYAGAIICVVTLIGMRVMPSAYRQD